METGFKGFEYHTNIRSNDILRSSFFELSRNTFGLDFEPWYKKGYWTDKYVPHVLTKNGQVVANASVNIIDVKHSGEIKRFIQIGTVMTREDYRNKGLSRFLMQKIVDEWKEHLIYLYANDSVLNFYPKMGFIKAMEYCFQIPAASGGKCRRLDMNDPAHVQLLLKLYSIGNPFSALQAVENLGLLMFYCGSFMSENVYYAEKYNAALVMEQEGDTCVIYDIFTNSKSNLEEILEFSILSGCKKIRFGFTPAMKNKITPQPINERDSTFFVYGKESSLFETERLMLPLLSHA